MNIFFKKALSIACMTALATTLLAGCGGAEESTSAEDDVVNIALVHTLSGLGDKGMNDTVLIGLQKAEELYGINYTNVEPKEQSDFDALLTQLAATEEFDLIISVGAEQKDALLKVAGLYPDQNFATNSYSAEGPNISSSDAIWEEFVFIAGYINARLATEGVLPGTEPNSAIGIIRAVDTPQQIKPTVGYSAGAKMANPEIEIFESVVGDFEDINTAKEQTLAQYNQGAVIVQNFAGLPGLGIIAAAQEAGLYASGVGLNQNDLAPDNIPFSTINATDNQILSVISHVVEGTWEPTTYYNGIAEDIYVVTAENSNLEIPEAIWDDAMALQEKVVSGELVIPTTYEEVDAWVAENR